MSINLKGEPKSPVEIGEEEYQDRLYKAPYALPHYLGEGSKTDGPRVLPSAYLGRWKDVKTKQARSNYSSHTISVLISNLP